MKQTLQTQFSNISRSHNVTIEEIKRLKKDLKKQMITAEQIELENQLLFWERMRYVQRDQISEIIHEVVRRNMTIKITGNEEEIVALVDFYSQRNIAGHKIICVEQELPKTTLVNKFLSAYCSENNCMMKYLMNDIIFNNLIY